MVCSTFVRLNTKHNDMATTSPASAVPYTHTLPCGMRVICAPSATDVVYCGIAVDAGTRDELPDENGLAHFCEHLTSKGRTDAARGIS